MREVVQHVENADAELSEQDEMLERLGAHRRHVLTALQHVEHVRTALAVRGLAANCWIDRKISLNKNQTVEWYAGQFVEIVDSKAWHAMQTWINFKSQLW